MAPEWLLRTVISGMAIVIVMLEIWWGRRGAQSAWLGKWTLAVLAGLNIAFVFFLAGNHLGFPLHLEVTEGTVLQHVERAAQGLPIYPEPGPAFVPLAYNPLFYFLSVPFTKALGLKLATLRLVAILGAAGAGAVMFLAVRRLTASAWWGWTAVGLYAATYFATGDYLDTAHSDSWLLFTTLLGTFLIDKFRDRRWSTTGVLLLVASFWLKQHGALFAVAGLVYLTWRDGARRVWFPWLAAVLAGPVLYILGGERLFGPRFHEFTWQVPRAWSVVSPSLVRRGVKFAMASVPFLSLASLWAFCSAAVRDRSRFTVWHVQWAAASLAAVMGLLDPGSANNIFIPWTAFTILLGLVGLHQAGATVAWMRPAYVSHAVLMLSFAALAYSPLSVVVPASARDTYRDLIHTLTALDGPVYAPNIGQFESGYRLSPSAHWVALEDMIRGPERDIQNHPNTKRLIRPALEPTGKAYLMLSYPLSSDPLLGFMLDCYTLDRSWGDRFNGLGVLPGLFSAAQAYPKYLYRFSGAFGRCIVDGGS